MHNASRTKKHQSGGEGRDSNQNFQILSPRSRSCRQKTGPQVRPTHALRRILFRSQTEASAKPVRVLAIAQRRVALASQNGRRFVVIPLSGTTDACARGTPPVASLSISIGGVMRVTDSVLGAIGNTPLIKLRQASQATGCDIYGKAEFMNPGGSVKDRAALAIIQDAIAKGKLKPGGTIVEGTAGNTGIGLALVANALGFRTVIVIPDTQSEEKKSFLRMQGAELIEVPAVPYSNPDNYVKVSGRLAEKLGQENPSGAIWANQFDNVANRRGHEETTGPEIYRQLDGKLDGFVCAVGTGGTLAGVGMALKARDARIKIALADPMGAALYAWYTSGVLKSEGSSITEGIGQGRITANLVDAPIDVAYQVADEEALPLVFDLAEYEGLLLGGSSGINIAGAIRLARDLGPGHTIVTILCDSGARYASKLYNPIFLRDKDLPVPGWLRKRPD